MVIIILSPEQPGRKGSYYYAGIFTDRQSAVRACSRMRPWGRDQMALNGWNTFSNQMTLLCFLAGGAAAFGAYWYRTDPYYIVLYGSMGILAGLFTILVDHGAGVGDKKQQLFTALDNYLENTLIYRLDQERDETQAISGPHMETRENIRSIYPVAAGTAPGQAEEPEKQENVRGKQRNRTELYRKIL